MPKRPREDTDEASEELIASIRDTDALENALNNFKSERASIQKVFEDAKVDIQKEFATTSPDTLSERDNIRYTTKVEFEQSLCDDRLRILEENIKEYTSKHNSECDARKRRRVVDRQITRCAEIAENKCSEADWKMIGKNKHVQTTLNDKRDTMTPVQKETYAVVLKELQQKGWRVLKCNYINLTEETNGTASAAEPSPG
tara:strand:- start:2830 stop:3429 length:600 start_codon:yes stop_codon:yes gene_type:complete